MKVYRFAVVLAAVFAACFACADFDRFQAWIGIDDGAKGRPGDGIFRVQVDGREVYKSAVLRPGFPAVKLDISMAGAKELRLFIDDEGNGHGGDWGEWLDARLVDSKTGESVFLTDLQPEEKAWIGACRDRNVVRGPLQVDGVTYLRGWGCISGSELLFKGWDKAVADAEAKVGAENAAAARQLGNAVLDLAGAQAAGIKIGYRTSSTSLDGKTKTTKLAPDAVLTVTTDPSNAAQAAWWKSDKTTVKIGDRRYPLLDLIQPTERFLHAEWAPNRYVLTGQAKAPAAVWGGKEIGAGPIKFTVQDLALAASRLPAAGATAEGKLIVKVKPFRTNEVPDVAAFTSALCKIVADGKEIGDVLSDNPATYAQSIPLDKWPARLECLTTPGDDGSLADSFVIDLGIQLGGMKDPLWLHTVDPSFQKFEYGQPDKMIAGESWRIPGLGVVRWLGLQGVLKAREAGLVALAEAKPAIEAAKSKEEIDAAVAKVVAVDPGQPDIRLIAAGRFKALNDAMQERRQLGLLLETSRADLKSVQDSRKRIDEIWASLLPSNRPWPTQKPKDPQYVAFPVKAVAILHSDKKKPAELDGPLPLKSITSFAIGPSNAWTRTVAVMPDKGHGIGFMVNSRGVECSLKLLDGDKTVAQKVGRYPFVVVGKSALSFGGELKAVIAIDPDSTGILIDHLIDVVAWPADDPSFTPSVEWAITPRPDGSAIVAGTAKGPFVAAIPRTATGLTVYGTSTLAEPTTEYMVQPDPKLGGNNLVLFATPSKDGGDGFLSNSEVRVFYEWPDAAYNVPMSHFDWDRLSRVYLQTPASLLETGAKTKWTVSNVPQAWVLHTSTPAPASKDDLTFEVEPQAGLSIVWNAKDVLTPWIAMKHKNLTMYIPDNPNNRYWFPLWMSYVRKVYDTQVENTGFEKPNYLYIGVQGASMLSGYGGGTAGDDHTSETWLPATGRCSPYFWMHNPNPSGVDSHELHWVAFGCFVEGLPVWVMNGFGGWIEETGWRSTDLAGCEEMMRNHIKNAAAALELIKAGGKNPMQSNQEEWDALPGPTREKMISLGWLISEELSKAYGKGFWAKFWAEQRAKNTDAYKKLTAHQKDVFFVDELVRISGDAKLRERFEKEWRFNLVP